MSRLLTEARSKEQGASLAEPLYAQRPELLPAVGSIERHIIGELAAKAREICVFCIQNRNERVFAEDTDGRIFFRYVTWHLLAGNVLVVRQQGKISGVAFVWPERAADVLERAKTGEPQFNWRQPVQGGDAVMIGQVIGTRTASYGFRKLCLQRWPEFHARRMFTHRRGKLVEMPAALIKRFCRGGWLPVSFSGGQN